MTFPSFYHYVADRKLSDVAVNQSKLFCLFPFPPFPSSFLFLLFNLQFCPLFSFRDFFSFVVRSNLFFGELWRFSSTFIVVWLNTDQISFYNHPIHMRRRIQHRHFGLRRCVSMSQRRMTQVVMLNSAPHMSICFGFCSHHQFADQLFLVLHKSTARHLLN